ncbi:hypothetical protein ACSHWG_02605 [Leucobacter sp. Z1108]|uniref:hypothetical protein n=1 Tax=Leucobacter sp. Z1108 TaxID=3439066 RepID=UPI003F2FCE4F
MTDNIHSSTPNRGQSADTRVDRPSRGDRAGIVLFMLIGVAIVAVTAYGVVQRWVELLGTGPVEVAAQFVDTAAEVPMGPAGAAVSVQLDRAIVLAPELPIASLGAGLLEATVLLVTVTTVVVCLICVARNILRGVIFSQSQTRWVATAAITALAGAALVPFFGNMVANGAIALLSDRSFENTFVLAVEPLPYFMGAFAASIAITAFSVGDRLRRETEGLV